jgi:transglutaminase-like putative cysteine protease
VPRSSIPYQKCRYSVTGAREFKHCQQGEQEWLEVVPDGMKAFRVQCHVRQQPWSFWPDLKAMQTVECIPLPSDDPYLAASDRVILSDLACQIAAPLKAKTQFQTAHNIMLWAERSLTYNSKSDPYVRNSEDCLKHREGVCDPQARAAVALLRVCGVPARVVREMGGQPPGWHSSVELRSPRTRPNGEAIWFPVGSTLNNFPVTGPMSLYPAVAPDADRAFPWEQWWTMNIETARIENERSWFASEAPPWD